MSGLFDITLLLIYLLPLLGLVLGTFPALLVWRYCKPRRRQVKCQLG